MNKPLLILFFIIGSFAFGQNLVPNPSFEEYDTCPTGVSTSWDSQIEKCNSWYAPSAGTSDYFNACNSSGVNVPLSAFGYQNALDGQGYVGVILLIQEGESSYYEYVQSQLTSSLVQGAKYKFSFNVNLANGSDYAVSSIGAWFSNLAITSSIGVPIFNTLPQIQNTSGFISDTVSWTKIEGEFVASGGEEFITIGYYTDTLAPDTLRNNPEAVPVVIYSYIYIDGLELNVIEPEILIPNVITPNNDGVNDLWTLPYSDQKQPKKVTIMNRWGNLIKEGDLNGFYWDGKTEDGVDCVDGNYFFKISNTNIAGFIQLIR